MNEQPRNSMLIRLRPLVFLLPAILTAGVILLTLPATQPILAAIPERLERITANVVETVVSPLLPDDAEEPEPAETEPEELLPGQYTDGIYTGSSQGYGGRVTVQVTVENGRIAAVDILSAAGETEPYITLARTIIDIVIGQQTWEVDAVSGATYSSRGILGAVRNAITGESVENEVPAKTSPAGTTVQDSFTEPTAYKDGIYYGSAEGFGGTIRVEVAISGGMIQSIRIVSAPYETAEYFSRAQNVVSAILRAGSPNVDAVSGATYSSTGIINAVKRALSQAASDGAEADPTMQEEPIPDVMPDEALADGVYIGTGEGFGGEIIVQATVSGGRITEITVVSADGETPEYFNRASGLIQQILKLQSAELDAVSGATYSSEGILEAAHNAFAQAAEKHGDDPKSDDPGIEEPGTDDSGANDTNKDNHGAEDPDFPSYRDGSYTAAGWCEDADGTFRYELLVTVTIRNGKIEAVDAARGIDESEDPETNETYLGYAVKGRARRGVEYAGVPTQIIDMQTAEGVDAVSGATYSSETIRALAAEALAQAVVPEEENEAKNEIEDGIYTGSAWCDDSDTFRYLLTVTVTISDGRIVSVDTVKTSDESENPEDNDAYLNYAVSGRTRRGVTYVGVPQQILNNQGADDIDAVSGATYSSGAIRNAVMQALGMGDVHSADDNSYENASVDSGSEESPDDGIEISTDVSEQSDGITAHEASDEPDASAVTSSFAGSESVSGADHEIEITEIENETAEQEDREPPRGDHICLGRVWEPEEGDHEAE